MFDIKKSEKNHIESPDQFVVVLDGIVYLRIAGEEGRYSVMTATAGEDYPGINSFSNQMALNKAALNVAALLNTSGRIKYDFHNREYVEICTCEYISDAYRVAENLFKKLDEDLET